MQRAFIIIIMVIFIISTIGFYIAALGTPPEERQAEDDSQQRQEAATPDIPEDTDVEVPDYVRTAGVDFRQVEDATGQEEVEITVGDNFFETTVLEVSAGTTLTWHNQGSAAHTITSDPDSPVGGLDSGRLAAGETYAVTLDEPGQYNYFCELHPASMRGSINVVD